MCKTVDIERSFKYTNKHCILNLVDHKNIRPNSFNVNYNFIDIIKPILKMFNTLPCRIYFHQCLKR